MTPQHVLISVLLLLSNIIIYICMLTVLRSIMVSSPKDKAIEIARRANWIAIGAVIISLVISVGYDWYKQSDLRVQVWTYGEIWIYYPDNQIENTQQHELITMILGNDLNEELRTVEVVISPLENIMGANKMDANKNVYLGVDGYSKSLEQNNSSYWNMGNNSRVILTNVHEGEVYYEWNLTWNTNWHSDKIDFNDLNFEIWVNGKPISVTYHTTTDPSIFGGRIEKTKHTKFLI